MVFSDDFLHFLKIKKKILKFTNNYLVTLKMNCLNNPLTQNVHKTWTL